jgi:hypothetical protein
MLYREIIPVFYTDRTEHISARRGQNAVILDVRAGAFSGVKPSFTRSVTSRVGRAMAQAVTGWPFTADDRVQSQASLSGICDGQSGTEMGFSPHISVLPHGFDSNNVPYSCTQLSPSLHSLNN